MKAGQWTWSFNDDEWYSKIFDTKEEAIEEGRKEAKHEGYKHFYVGQIQPVELPLIDVDDILDDLGQQVYDEAGSVAEDYLYDVSWEDKEALEDALNQAFRKWAEERGYLPRYFKVKNIERVEV